MEVENNLGADQHKIEKQIGSQESWERAAGDQKAGRALKKGIARTAYRAIVAQMRLDLATNAPPQAPA